MFSCLCCCARRVSPTTQPLMKAERPAYSESENRVINDVTTLFNDTRNDNRENSKITSSMQLAQVCRYYEVTATLPTERGPVTTCRMKSYNMKKDDPSSIAVLSSFDQKVTPDQAECLLFLKATRAKSEADLAISYSLVYFNPDNPNMPKSINMRDIKLRKLSHNAKDHTITFIRSNTSSKDPPKYTLKIGKKVDPPRLTKIKKKSRLPAERKEWLAMNKISECETSGESN